MNETMMSKATFSEICKIMNHKDGEIRNCIHSVIRLSVLMFPGLICKDIVSAAALETGLLNVDVKDVIDTTIDTIKSAFGTKHDDFTTRAQDAQIAHVLIVFAAYFDSIKQYLPDANREFALSDKEKYSLSQDSIDEYTTYLSEQANLQRSEDSFELTEFAVPFPNTVEGFSASVSRLEKFYEILNTHFLNFVEKLSYIESIPGHKRDHFYAIMRAIPKIALTNYENQYNELSSLFPDFFVWATHREHEAIHSSIDIGFTLLSRKFENIAEETSSSICNRAFSILHRKYIQHIQSPIVSHSDLPLGDNEISLPSIDTCFIPQDFRTLIYEKGLPLSDSTNWKKSYELGPFIADTLRSPELGAKPILILGDPGAGKTMLTKMLAAKILCNEYHVIIINLRNVNAENEIFEQINQELSRNLSGLPCTWGDIIYTKLQKPILLIFDGYDELLQASGKTHSDYIQRIASFQEDTARDSGAIVRSIVTSRIVLIDKAQLPDGSVIAKLEKFDDERIDLWCAIWNHHNSSYFANTGVKPFSVTAVSKSLDLATQPLLLLMLALFDSNSNALHSHKNLSTVELYNTLIRDFIIREQKKNPGFCRQEIIVQSQIVDQEMERISIAALGMYNRKLLHIRSPQLQEDLTLLSTVANLPELTYSEKLLGSFFFLHRSESIDPNASEASKLSAYEFLHNTFGEFLTAYYVTLQLHALFQHVKTQPNNEVAVQMADQYKWYVCLSYAPLFNRPVIADMIAAWGPIYFKEKGLEQDETQAAILKLLDSEMHKILSGRIDSELTELLHDFNSLDGYPHMDIRMQVAIYSINLLSIVSLLLDGLPIESLKKNDAQAWEKLRHIWHYSFTDEDLHKWASCYHVQYSKTTRFISRRRNDVNQAMIHATDFGPFNNFVTHMAFDEELDYLALGMLHGFDYKAVNEGLKRHNIPGRTWNALMTIIRQPFIFTEAPQYNELLILDDLFMFGMEDEDYGALYYAFLLLKYLSDPKNQFLTDPFDIQYSNVGWLCYAYRTMSTQKKQVDKPIRLIILEILNQITLDTDTCEILCRELFPYKFKRDSYSTTEIMYISQLGRRIIDTYLLFNEKVPMHLLDSFVKRLADSFEMICKWHREPMKNGIIEEVLQTTVQLLNQCDDENIYHVLMIFRDYLERMHNHEDFFLTVKEATLLIESLAIYHKDEDDGSKLAVELMPYILNSGMRIVDLFDCSPASIQSLCSLICLFPHDIGLKWIPMLVELIDQRTDSISFGIYKSIQRIAHDFNSNEINDALMRNLN